MLLLTVFPIGCCYYYTWDWIKKEHDVSYYYKMNNLKEINRKNHTCYYFNDICRTEDFDFDNVLLDEKSYENVLVHDISSWVLKNHLKIILLSNFRAKIKLGKIKYW